jgi:ATP-dependent protease HslVU (ClpYQ) peptidase subunit
MTCIVGLVSHGRVFIGGDSAGVAGYNLTARKDPKVGRVGPLVIGFTTSFRMGQLLLFGFTPPRFIRGHDEPYAWMQESFIPAARARLKEGGYVKIDSGREDGGSFLVGLTDRLFQVEDDFQVAENHASFDACGCGHAYAKGALAAMADGAPEDRIQRSLEIAERFSAGVRGPFTILATDAPQAGAGERAAA